MMIRCKDKAWLREPKARRSVGNRVAEFSHLNRDTPGMNLLPPLASAQPPFLHLPSQASASQKTEADTFTQLGEISHLKFQSQQGDHNSRGDIHPKETGVGYQKLKKRMGDGS